MWTCVRCREEHDEQFESCWKCQTLRHVPTSTEETAEETAEETIGTDPIVPAKTRASVIASSALPSVPETRSDVRQAMIYRYRDAYRVAQTIVLLGKVIKAFAIFVFIAIAVLSLFSGSQDSGVRFVAPIFGVGIITSGILAAVIYVVGIVVTAHGQLLMATLDNAVNSSPFLTDRERANVMLLRN